MGSLKLYFGAVSHLFRVCLIDRAQRPPTRYQIRPAARIDGWLKTHPWWDMPASTVATVETVRRPSQHRIRAVHSGGKWSQQRIAWHRGWV